MKDSLIQMALMIANTVLTPALKAYAAKTDTKIDDIFVDAFASVMADPRLSDELRKILNAG